MGRRSHVKMKVLDFKVVDHQTLGQVGAVSVQVRKGKHEFKLAYAIKKTEINEFNWEEFKVRVYRDALKKIMDQEFEDKALQSISDFIGVELELD